MKPFYNSRPEPAGPASECRRAELSGSAPGSAQPLPSAVGEEGACGPLATAALYACVTRGQSWDVESRISLVVSMLPSNLDEDRKTSRDKSGPCQGRPGGPRVTLR